MTDTAPRVRLDYGDDPGFGEDLVDDPRITNPGYLKPGDTITPIGA